jgi:hypothetical protein
MDRSIRFGGLARTPSADARTAFGLIIISHDDSRLQKRAHFRRAPAVREAYREDVSSLARTRRLR